MPAVVEDGKIKVTSDIVELSDTTPTTLISCSEEKRKYVMKKIYIYNPDTSDHVVTIGEYNTTSVSWVKDKYVFKVAAGEEKIITEDEIPVDYVMTSDASTAAKAWAAKLDAAVAANNVKIKIEIELQ